MHVRIRYLSLIIAIFCLLPVASPGNASASGYHAYSVVYEQSFPGLLQGAWGNRLFVSMSTTCVYEPVWLQFENNAGWIEIGVSHSCITAGETDLYVWVNDPADGWNNFVATTAAPLNSGGHRLAVYKTSTAWGWDVDGTCNIFCGTAGIAPTPRWGSTAVAGLESYDSSASVAETTWNLHIKYADRWINWAGQDNKEVDTTLGMCGRWVSDIYWSYGEHHTC